MTERSYWSGRMSRGIGRRAVLRGSALTGAGIAAAALIGCGGGSNSTAAPAKTGGTAAAGAAGSATPTLKRGGTYKTFTSADPPTIDVNSTPSASSHTFAAFVYSRLYRIDAQPGTNPWDRQPIGDLAESAETKDGMTWIVKLRKGVKFQNVDPVNGREFTAQDYIFSWDKFTGPKSTLKAGVRNIKAVTAIDNYTLQFTHDAPNADFLEQMADGFLLWVTPTESDGKFDLATKAIGTGPWMLDKYAVSQQFVFKKNPDYFVPGVPYMDGVVQTIIPEYANQIAQFQGGNIFEMGGLRADDVLTLRKQLPQLQWLAATGTGVYGLYFSGDEQDPTAPWRDDRFRIATSYAINRDELAELLYNVKALKAAGLEVTSAWNNLVAVGMGNLWWLDPKSPAQGPSGKYFNYDPAEARKLLDAVGVSKTTKIPFSYTNNRYAAIYTTAAEAILAKLTDVGLPMQGEAQDYNSKFVTQTWQGRFHGIALGNFGGFSSLSGYLGEQIDDNPDNRRLLHTKDILDLKKKQAETIDVKARAEVMAQLQRTSDEHMYTVPTTGGGGTSYIPYQPQVRGVRRTRGLAGPAELLPYYSLDS